eukprot:3336034-Karenia_brevis.AAC.2
MATMTMAMMMMVMVIVMPVCMLRQTKKPTNENSDALSAAAASNPVTGIEIENLKQVPPVTRASSREGKENIPATQPDPTLASSDAEPEEEEAAGDIFAAEVEAVAEEEEGTT